MPVGLGAGKVIITDPAVINVFFKPQVAVATKGPGQREWGAFLASSGDVPSVEPYTP